MLGRKLFLVFMFLPIVSGFVVSQMTNDTMNPSYLAFTNGREIPALFMVYTESMGSWFIFTLCITGWAGIYLYQARQSNIATMWMTAWWVAYGSYVSFNLFEMVFFLLTLAWLTELLRKALSGVYTY